MTSKLFSGVPLVFAVMNISCATTTGEPVLGSTTLSLILHKTPPNCLLEIRALQFEILVLGCEHNVATLQFTASVCDIVHSSPHIGRFQIQVN